VLRRLRYALEQGSGPALLFGGSGSGKTLLARRLASELKGPAVHLAFPAIGAEELLMYLAEEFGGLNGAPSSRQGALRQLRNRLAGLVARGERPLLVVDDAHLIRDGATFEALQLLLNFATEGPPDLAMVLAGGAEILLELPSGLADRLAARALLGPFTEAESSAYVLGRLEAAGAKSPLFSPEALIALYRAALGQARRLNRLADLALLIAYAQDLPAADERCVAIAAREFTRDLAAA
jgi:type II secretory pathway predicted ATPase ExeA